MSYSFSVLCILLLSPKKNSVMIKFVMYVQPHYPFIYFSKG